MRWNPLPGGGMNPHPSGMYVRFEDLAQASTKSVAQVQVNAGAVALNWEPLPEDAYEREMYDRNLGLLYQGDTRIAVTTTLELWGKTMANGSFSRMCCVLANEVAKLYLAPAPQTASSPSPAGESDKKDADRLDWLMMKTCVDDIGIEMPFGIDRAEYLKRFRTAIDAAMSREGDHK